MDARKLQPDGPPCACAARYACACATGCAERGRGEGGREAGAGKGGRKRDVEHTRSRWVKLSLSLGREGNSAAVLNPAKLAKLRYYYSTDEPSLRPRDRLSLSLPIAPLC